MKNTRKEMLLTPVERRVYSEWKRVTEDIIFFVDEAGKEYVYRAPVSAYKDTSVLGAAVGRGDGSRKNQRYISINTTPLKVSANVETTKGLYGNTTRWLKNPRVLSA